MRSYPLLKIPTIADPAHVSDVMHVNTFHSSNQTYYILPNYSFSSWQTNNIVALAVFMFILNISNKQNFNAREALFHTETWPSPSQLTFMTVNNVKPFTQVLTYTSSDIHGIRKTICTPIHVFTVPHYVWLKIFAQTSSNHHLIRA